MYNGYLTCRSIRLRLFVLDLLFSDPQFDSLNKMFINQLFFYHDVVLTKAQILKLKY